MEGKDHPGRWNRRIDRHVGKDIRKGDEILRREVRTFTNESGSSWQYIRPEFSP